MSDRAFMVYNIKNQLADENGDYAGRIYEREIHIPSSEVLTLSTIHKELVPAQGKGKVIEFISAVLFLDWGGTQYTTAGDLRFRMATAHTIVSDQIDAGDFINQTADTYRVVQTRSSDISLEDNEALELQCGTTDPLAGNSPIDVRVMYRIHDFN